MGEGGAALRLAPDAPFASSPKAVGESITVSFELPGTRDQIRALGRIVWSTAGGEAGVQFTWISDAQRLLLERWLTGRMEHAVAELRSQLAVACA